MFTPGNILHGLFQLKDIQKYKYVIILYKDDNNCILTTFTTSQQRSGVVISKHGKNINSENKVMSYVFKQGVPIGAQPCGTLEFSFSKDTIVVPDYGFEEWKEVEINKKVRNLNIVCRMYPKEYKELIYTLYQGYGTSEKYRKIFEELLSKIIE
jgi:hypothetical protein